MVETLQTRGYAAPDARKGAAGALVPSLAAFAVTQLLEAACPSLVEARSTALMEEALDDIAAGRGKVALGFGGAESRCWCFLA